MSSPRQPRRPAAANNQVVRAHLARKTLPEFLSELEKNEETNGRRPRSLVTLSPDDSLAAASAALAAARILSAPVIDDQQQQQRGAGRGVGTFCGFFEVADYLRAVVDLARERCPELLLLDSFASASAGAGAGAWAPSSASAAPSPSSLLPPASASD